MSEEAKIKFILAREILDSRGNPTVEVDLHTGWGRVRATVPSGASTGVHEAKELRDGDSRFLGQGVRKAVRNINEVIAPELVGQVCTKQREIDQLMLELDSTRDKSKLGANAILACSMVVSRAGALHSRQPLFKYLGQLVENEKFVLPVPWMNVINGGEHAGNDLDFQEYHVVPTGASSYTEALRIGTEVYQYLKIILRQRFGEQAINVGDEGGFSPPLNLLEDPLRLIMDAAREGGYEQKISLGIDVAASVFFKNGKYRVEGRDISPKELLDIYVRLSGKYPLILIEDGFAEDAWSDWQMLKKTLGGKLQVVGDDLTATNIDRIDKAVKANAINSVIIKINQIGTISEVVEAVKYARIKNLKICVANRSGETEDTYIAALAVGLGAKQCKFGAPARSERTAKYNKLLRIEERLAERAELARIV